MMDSYPAKEARLETPTVSQGTMMETEQPTPVASTYLWVDANRYDRAYRSGTDLPGNNANGPTQA